MVVGLACTNVLRQPPRVVPAATVILLCSVGSAFRPLKRLWRCRAVAERAVAEAIPVWEWLEQKPQPAVVPKAGTIRPLAGELSLLNVTVRDGAGNLRVDNVSLSVPAGGQVALFADQPATLTALVSLLPRWCDPERGAIVMDGQDIKGATLESLRTEVALVVAEPLIFSGTVADNITCGDPRLVSKLMTKAARWTNAYSFIQALPQNFDTVIGHGGHPLTIAEQFRIALARALIRNPSLVVIEEPDVPLPPEVAELVDQAIDRISANRTLIRIPARLSGLRQAQRVAVFGEGKLVAEGTHADLLKTCDLYRHLQYLRFNEFRPAPVEPQPRLRAS
jgi:ATP-binding cassette subfamily B protein